MLMVDISGSKFFGTESELKKNIVTEISATLAFSAIQNNDKVGLILFTDQVELYIPPSKGKTHILRIIRELIEFKPKSKKTNLSVALEFFSNVISKKSIALLVKGMIESMACVRQIISSDSKQRLSENKGREWDLSAICKAGAKVSLSMAIS